MINDQGVTTRNISSLLSYFSENVTRYSEYSFTILQ